MTEQAFFEKDGVKVTSTRFIVLHTTYAVSNITSAKIRAELPERKWPALLGIVGVFLLPSATVAGIIFIAAAAFWWMKQKAMYYIILATSGGEQQALKSTAKHYVDEVYSALNSAIVSRG